MIRICFFIRVRRKFNCLFSFFFAIVIYLLVSSAYFEFGFVNKLLLLEIFYVRIFKVRVSSVLWKKLLYNFVNKTKEYEIGLDKFKQKRETKRNEKKKFINNRVYSHRNTVSENWRGFSIIVCVSVFCVRCRCRVALSTALVMSYIHTVPTKVSNLHLNF